MKSHPSAFLKFAAMIALGSPLAILAGTDSQTCDQQVAQACTSTCPLLQKLEDQALANPSKAGEVLASFVSAHPEDLQLATLRLVGSFAAKLPADQLKPALASLMQSATTLLSSRLQPAAHAANASEEDIRLANFEQDMRLAAAVQELTRAAVAAIKANLSAPARPIAPEADGSYPNGALLLDPQDYASLMKSSMEQVVKGALVGMGNRANRIPEAYLPALAGIQADKDSYAYSLIETAGSEKIPAALAAPMDEKPADKK